eukprot:6751198-Prymnesium_polylepis.1
MGTICLTAKPAPVTSGGAAPAGTPLPRTLPPRTFPLLLTFDTAGDDLIPGSASVPPPLG